MWAFIQQRREKILRRLHYDWRNEIFFPMSFWGRKEHIRVHIVNYSIWQVCKTPPRFSPLPSVILLCTFKNKFGELSPPPTDHLNCLLAVISFGLHQKTHTSIEAHIFRVCHCHWRPSSTLSRPIPGTFAITPLIWHVPRRLSAQTPWRLVKIFPRELHFLSPVQWHISTLSLWNFN